MKSQDDKNLNDISEGAVIELFREFIYKDFGYKDVEKADPKSVFTKFINPYYGTGDNIFFKFLHLHVFGKSICNKFERHNLKVDKRNKVDKSDEKSLRLYEDFFLSFHPDVIYSFFNAYRNPNFLVLKKSSLDDEEKSELVSRGGKWLEILYEMEHKIECFDTWRLSNNLESVIGKVEPDVDKWSFLNTGRVVKIMREEDIDDYLSIPGMVVDKFEKDHYVGSFLTLINAVDPKKFNYLVGRDVIYHYIGFIRSLAPIPYGELISIPKQ